MLGVRPVLFPHCFPHRHHFRGKARIVPVHPELRSALASFLAFRDVPEDAKLVNVTRHQSPVY